MYGQVTEPTVQRKFLKVSKTHTYGGILQDATSLYIPDMFTNVHSKTRCGRINITYKNEAKCRQLFACSQLGANHSPMMEHWIYGRVLNIDHLFIFFSQAKLIKLCKFAQEVMNILKYYADLPVFCFAFR